MNNIRQVVNIIVRVLDMLKGFSTGTSSTDPNHIIVWVEDVAYKVTFEEVKNDKKNPMNVIRRELK